MKSSEETVKQEQGTRSRAIRVIVSFVIAFFVWMAAMLAAPEISLKIRDVPVDVSSASSRNLEVVDGQQVTATVYLDGKQYEISSYTSRDILLKADLSDVTGSGVFEVPLFVQQNGGQRFNVTAIVPSTVTMTFDNRMVRDFPIEYSLGDMKLPEGYICLDDAVAVEPGTVRITGAEAVVSKIAKAALSLKFEKGITSSRTLQEKIHYYDADGRELDFSDTGGFHPSASEASLSIPVKKVMELPLTVSFLNVPTGFPLGELQYELSRDTLLVAAEEDEIRNYRELTLGYVDMKQLNPLREASLSCPVRLPEGFLNLQGTDAVDLTFPGSRFGSAVLTLKNFKTVNVPENWTVTPVQSSVKTTVVGDRKIIGGVVAGDFIVELDFADTDLKAGTYELPVAISAPTKGLVWAVGDHTVTVNVRKAA